MSATVSDDLTARVAVLEQIAKDTRDTLARIELGFERGLGRVDTRLDRVDTRLDRLDGRIDRVEARIDRMDERINARIDTSLRWLITLGLGGFATLLATMAHGFHWI